MTKNKKTGKAPSKCNAKPIETQEKCHYGCDEQAHYIFDNGKLCCRPDFKKCPGWKKLISRLNKGQKAWNKGRPTTVDEKAKIGMGNKGKQAVIYAHPVITEQLCDYGCGRQAKYVFNNKKLCCTTDFKACPGFVNRLNNIKKDKYPKTLGNIGVDIWTFDRLQEIAEDEGISIPIYIRDLIYKDLKKRLQ